MSSLPSPPFVSIPGIHNFRSTGTHPTSSKSPTHTRSAYLYRSGAPTNLPASSLSTLHSLGITYVYDLRSLPEIAKLAAQCPVYSFPNITRVFCPVFQDTDYSPERIATRYANYAHSGGAEGFVRAYADILEAGKGAFRTVFEHVRDRPAENLLVHCTAGKDRTGVLVALALGVAGVERERVAEEYALTEKGLEGWKEVIAAHLLKEEGSDKEGVENMLSARKQNMMATLEMIEERYGGAEGYLRDMLGFNEEDITIIRTNLLEETPP